MNGPYFFHVWSIYFLIQKTPNCWNPICVPWVSIPRCCLWECNGGTLLLLPSYGTEVYRRQPSPHLVWSGLMRLQTQGMELALQTERFMMRRSECEDLTTSHLRTFFSSNPKVRKTGWFDFHYVRLPSAVSFNLKRVFNFFTNSFSLTLTHRSSKPTDHSYSKPQII